MENTEMVVKKLLETISVEDKKKILTILTSRQSASKSQSQTPYPSATSQK